MAAESWNVGVPGATGIVGRQLVRRLADHVIPIVDGEAPTIGSHTTQIPGPQAGAEVTPW